MEHLGRLFQIRFVYVPISCEGRHRVFGLNKSACSKFDGKLNWIHNFIVERRLWKCKSENDLMSLIGLTGKSLSLLVSPNCTLDHISLHEPRKMLTHISGEICIHSQKEDYHISDWLLSDLVSVCIDNHDCIFNAMKLVAIKLSSCLFTILLDFKLRSKKFFLTQIKEFLVPFNLSIHAWNNNFLNN